MSTQTVLQTLEEKRLVPVAVIGSVDDGLKLSEALLKAGLNVIEVTLRTPAAKDAIAAIRKEFPDMLVGAGTVLEVEQVKQLVDLDAKFVVSPGVNPEVIKACLAADLPPVPGIITPTELQQAMSLGLKVLKFFPAEPAGGVKMLKALIAAYGHTGVKFVPTGGIDSDKAAEYWKLPQVAAVGGSWFVSPELIKTGNYEAIEHLTQIALAQARNISHQAK